jgi:hypothetical protein
LADKSGRPFLYCERRYRKEEPTQQFAPEGQLTEGLISVLSSLETCSTLRILYGKGRPLVKITGAGGLPSIIVIAIPATSRHEKRDFFRKS